MDVEYTGILSQLVANMDITYWSFCSSSRMKGVGVKGLDRGEDRYFSQLQVSL